MVIMNFKVHSSTPRVFRIRKDMSYIAKSPAESMHFNELNSILCSVKQLFVN